MGLEIAQIQFPLNAAGDKVAVEATAPSGVPLPTSIRDEETLDPARVSPLRFLASSFETISPLGGIFPGTNLDETAWQSATITTGGVAVSSGEVRLSTGIGGTGAAAIVSQSAPPTLSGFVNSIRFFVRVSAAVASNRKWWGALEVVGVVPQNGYAFRTDGTTMQFVIVKATAVSGTDASAWTVPFTLDANFHLYEIRFVANRLVDIFVDGTWRHRFNAAGTTTTLTDSLFLTAFLLNQNAGSVSNTTLASAMVTASRQTGSAPDLRAYRISTNGTIILKRSAAYVGGVNVGVAGSAANRLALYDDNVSPPSALNLIANIDTSSKGPATFPPGVTTSRGLVAVLSGGTAADATVLFA